MASLTAPVPPHRIQTLRFEFDGPDEPSLLRMRNRLDALCADELKGLLNDLFNGLTSDDEILEIPRLEIELGEVDASLKTDDLRAAISAALHRTLRERPSARAGEGGVDTPPAGAERAVRTPTKRYQSLAAHRRELYVHYLLHGDLGAAEAPADLRDLIAEAPATRAFLEEILRGLAGAGAAQLRGALERLMATAPAALSTMLETHAGDADLRRIGRSGPAEDEPPMVRAREILAALRSDQLTGDTADVDNALENSERESPSDEGATRAVIHAPNAGVVLLHVFLPQLFDGLGLLDGARFRTEACQLTAVRLIHYLATAETQCQEPLLVLPRLLCDLGPEVPVLEGSRLTAEQTDLADRLLESAIGHWKKLGNTSAAGLRETFLTRPGVLKRSAERTRLIIERRGVDVLLGSMPWALNPVRLPWRAHLLAVDWV